MIQRSVPAHYVALSGSERSLPIDAHRIGSVDPEESVEVSIYLKDPAPEPLVTRMAKAKEPQEVPRLNRKDYIDKHSAKEEDINNFKVFARDNGLSMGDVDRSSRKIVLRGTASAISHAFLTELDEYEHQGKRFRGRTGPLYLPTHLAEKTESILGTDNRRQADPRTRRHNREKTTFKTNALPQSYTPPELAVLYDFPKDMDGSDQRIAIIELGGGFRQQDLKDYFEVELSIQPLPTVTSVSVNGAQNAPIGNPDSEDGEVDLDIEIAGAIAPNAAIDVYFTPNTAQGFIDAVNAATHNTRYPPDIISISWGAPEIQWTLQAMNTMNQAFAAAGALGITIFCAAGDQGSTDGVTDGKNHVDFPGSSPYATSCGGTRLESQDGKITSEEVWNENSSSSATGGGISAVFDLPSWQANANVPLPSENGKKPKRGVPDVAGDADPQTGYKVRVDGADLVFGGTSAVAPLWAGLTALLNQSRKAQNKPTVGYLNPVLYQNYQALLQARALRDVSVGNNGAFIAKAGWDACTGVGTPDGSNLATTLP